MNVIVSYPWIKTNPKKSDSGECALCSIHPEWGQFCEFFLCFSLIQWYLRPAISIVGILKKYGVTKGDFVFRFFKPHVSGNVIVMNKKRLFCCYCGNTIIQSEIEGKLRDYCSHCNTVFYENPLPVASCIVVNEGREILLVKRKNEPYRGMWCLPIGFAETDEEVKDTALRELEEEAGIKGKIIRLIDVDTIENYFYGSMAIVTYEAEAAGGTLRAGDDASDAGYFPIMKLPELAWSSNKKAIDIYIDQNRDSWAMVDSFKRLFPDMDPMEGFLPKAEEQKRLLSNILMKIIERDREEISRNWSEDIKAMVPNLTLHLEALAGMNKDVLMAVRHWLQGKSRAIDFEKFTKMGENLSRLNIPLPDALNAMALSRNSIWSHVVQKKILSSPLKIYTTLEFNNRIIFIYDRINYYITTGYCGSPNT